MMDESSLKGLQYREPKLTLLQWFLNAFHFKKKPSAEETRNGIVPIPGPPRKIPLTMCFWDTLILTDASRPRGWQCTGRRP